MPSAIGVQSTPPSSTTLAVWAGVIGCGFTGHVGGVAAVRRRRAGRRVDGRGARGVHRGLAAGLRGGVASEPRGLDGVGRAEVLLLLCLRVGLGDRRVHVDGGPGLGGRDRERRHGQRGDECAGDAHEWCSWWLVGGSDTAVIATFAPATCSSPSIGQQRDSAAAVTGS